jgi:hypothetical protein
VGPTETYIIDNASGNQVGTFSTPVFLFGNRVDPRYSKILQVENGGQSWYNGLAVQLRKRMSHGLSMDVSYTWSHAIEDGDEQGASWNVSSTYNNATFNGNYPLDKGSSALDQRHRAVINFVWMPKFTNSGSFFARNFVNGWGLSGITTLASAHPTSAVVSFSGNSTMNGSGGWTRVPFWPVNSLDIDRIYNVDARITRSIPIHGETMKLNLAFEAFNVFNTIHNTGVQTTAYTAAGGVLKPTLTNGISLLGVGNASQGFPDGTNARRCQVALRFTF